MYTVLCDCADKDNIMDSYKTRNELELPITNWSISGLCFTFLGLGHSLMTIYWISLNYRPLTTLLLRFFLTLFLFLDSLLFSYSTRIRTVTQLGLNLNIQSSRSLHMLMQQCPSPFWATMRRRLFHDSNTLWIVSTDEFHSCCKTFHNPRNDLT